MTAPFPAPNPGSQLRRTVRTAIFEWLTAQQILGLDAVWPSYQRINFDAAADAGGPAFACQAYVRIPRFRDTLGASTGPNDPGGILRIFEVEIHFEHVQHVPDEWAEGQDDYDRIIDAVLDALHARGRDLGRPEVVLGAANWPEDDLARAEDEEPVQDDSEGGPVGRNGVIYFNVQCYLPTHVP